MTNLELLCSEIAREQDSLLEPGFQRAQARRRLMNQPVRALSPRLRTGLKFALSLGCALASSVGAFYWQAHRSEYLTATAGESGAAVISGTWLNAPEEAAIPLKFSDGTLVEIRPRSRARLIELGTRGAQVALESGQADVNVAHGKDRQWQLRAGPFTVRVTGTRFHLAWSPNDDKFELVLTEGQVELAGCGFGSSRRLVAGQSVRASCRNNSVKIDYSDSATPGPSATLQVATGPTTSSELGSAASSRSDAPTSQAVTATIAARDPISRAPVNPAASTVSDWAALAKQGKYGDALQTLEHLGFNRECGHMRADELVLLSDTARRARSPERAKQALTTLRQRFAGSSQAATAAYSLGVIEFDQYGSFARASDWFRAYLQEAPAGPLTREARGRIMEASYRSGGSDARRLATDYLRDYPAGPHAALAQVILGSQKRTHE